MFGLAKEETCTNWSLDYGMFYKGNDSNIAVDFLGLDLWHQDNWNSAPALYDP